MNPTPPPLRVAPYIPALQNQASALTVAELGRICLRHFWPSALMAAIAAIAVFWAAQRVVPLYQAKAGLGMDSVAKSVVFQGNQEATSDQNPLITQRDLLLSTPVLSRALEHPVFATMPAYAGPGLDRVALLRLRLQVFPSHDSPSLELALRDEDAERATQALQVVIDAFLARQKEQAAERTAKQMEAMEKQVADARERLEVLRENERTFRQAHAILSANSEDNYVAIRLRELNVRRADLDKQLAASNSLKEQLQPADALTDPEARLQALLRVDQIGQNSGVVAAQKALSELRDKELVLGQKYLAKHPRIIEIREQIAGKQAELASAVALARESLMANDQKLHRESDQLNIQIAKEEADLAAYRNNLFSLQVLSKETQSQEEVYQQMLTRLNQEKSTSQLQATFMTISEFPKAELLPINVHKTSVIAGAVAMALLAGVCTAFLLHAIDRRVRGIENVRNLTRLPVVARIPYVQRLAPLARGGNHEQHPHLAEAYRGLRTALKMTLRGDGCQMLAVSSSMPHEGKSTVCAHLAVSLAATGARVLLVDGDMRKPSLDALIGETCERGLSSLLGGEADGVGPLPTSYKNLDFLGVGKYPHNPAELLHSPRLGELVEQWRLGYNYIVMDTSPLGPVSDGLLLGALADGFLLVVRDRYTNKSHLAQSVAAIAPLGRRVVGVIFNCDRGVQSKYGYPHLYSTANRPPAAEA